MLLLQNKEMIHIGLYILSKLTFIKGGLTPVTTLIETLGFQRAYAVNYKMEISETLVCSNTTLEYETYLDLEPKCDEKLLFESLTLAQKYVFGKCIENKNLLKETLTERKNTLAYKLSSIWHSVFPSDSGVKPTVDSFEDYAKKEIKRMHNESSKSIKHTPFPFEIKCGAILPIGTDVYNLRADEILFSGNFTVNIDKVTHAEPMYISLDKNEMHIRYCLNDTRNYMLDPDDACEDGILKKCFSNSRYFTDEKAVIKVFEDLKSNMSLEIK